MSSAMTFDMVLAHGIHDTAFDMYPDVICGGNPLNWAVKRMIIGVADSVVSFTPRAFTVFHTRS